MGSPVEGIQGQGLATVWDKSPDFWRYAQTANRPQQEAAQRALENERKLRDDLIKENRQFAPGKVWEPFYGEVEDYVHNNVRQFTLDNLNKNVPPGAFEGERSRRIGESKKLENKINYFKTVHEDVSKRIDDDNNLQKSYYETRLNDYFFNGRQAKPSDSINVDGIENIFNDSKGYDMSAVASSFMKELPQQLTEKYRKVSTDLGEQFDVSIIKSKLGTKQNADGSVKLDPRTGLPEIELTDDVTMAALDNPYIRNFVIDNLGPDAIKPNSDMERVKDLLAPVLTPYDQRAMQKQNRNGFKYSDSDKINYGSGYRTPIKNLEDRYDTLHRITHEHDPELLASLLPGLEGVNIGYQIFAPGESKKAPPRILVEYPNKQWNKDVDKPEERITKKTLSLETEEDRQAAMEFLSTVMDDKLPTNQKIGEEFTNFRKKKRKSVDKPGTVYSDETSTASDDRSGGIY
jgi:hypothetical protein